MSYPENRVALGKFMNGCGYKPSRPKHEIIVGEVPPSGMNAAKPSVRSQAKGYRTGDLDNARKQFAAFAKIDPDWDSDIPDDDHVSNDDGADDDDWR